jgi:hypothetical protein
LQFVLNEILDRFDIMSRFAFVFEDQFCVGVGKVCDEGFDLGGFGIAQSANKVRFGKSGQKVKFDADSIAQKSELGEEVR